MLPAMTPVRRTILVIEDDLDFADQVRLDLVNRGYDVRHAASRAEALTLLATGAPDLLVVDRTLPDGDGISIVAELRGRGVLAPVLILSALGAVDDRVLGLEAGGDDYLVKPASLLELAARIAALLRRVQDTRQTGLRVGDLTLDLIGRTARRGARDIELLPREFRLLEYLMRRPGQDITRQMLLESVWQYRFFVETNLVDVHVGKLRRKIERPGEKPLITSIRGVGFRFEDEEA
ncbi:MAG: response regulator transcription factor [Janthinobacterium lividum]